MTLMNRAAIAGIGYTPYSRDSGVSTLTSALTAIVAAVRDAGLALSDVDGFVTHSVGDSAQLSTVVNSLRARDPRVVLDIYGGGSMSAATIGAASMAIACGQADVVVVWRALNARSEFRMGGTGRPAPMLVESQYQVPYGLVAPPEQYALMGRAYMARSGATEEDLGRVAITQRQHAIPNERALMRTPLTMEQYLAARWIAEPLRLFDCTQENDAAVALVLVGAARARDLRQPPVLVRAATSGGGHSMFSNGRDDYSTSAAQAMGRRLFAAAEMTPADVDVAELYDAFSPMVLMQLEDYGFVAPGEAAAFVADGQTTYGGRLPTNTHGGHLSEGYVHGLNHVVEAVIQLRGHAGVRQVPSAEVALSTGQAGYVAGLSSAVLLTTDIEARR